VKSTRDPRIDDYISNAAPFAQPVLKYLREVVHRGCPSVQETVKWIKWSSPFFMHGDGILCNMAAFKAHVAFGFWHRDMQKILADAGAEKEGARGSFGRIESIKDVPPEKTLLRLIGEAMRINETGKPARGKSKPKPEVVIPPAFAAALKAHPAAQARFAAFSPSHRREYIEWIADAKREETRQKRIETAIEWVSSGKSRNWKYEAC
jgi:uncharacterized protein YdeI (YjbR/CyaY-like superfamily)